MSGIRINCYQGTTELRQLAIIESNKSRISVSPYDTMLIGPINTTLKAQGFDSYIFSKTSVVVNIPQPCGEEKEKVIKYIRKFGEEAKISIRNIRKKARKECYLEKEIQKMTDSAIEEIEGWIKLKIEEL